MKNFKCTYKKIMNNRILHFAALLLSGFFLVFSGLPVHAQLRVLDLRCEYLADPVGIGVKRPQLSWKFAPDGRNQYQTAYQVLAASSSDLLRENKADMWNSGRVSSDESIHVEYDGLIVQVDALVEDLGALPAIILFNDDLPVSTGALLGTPLHYLYGFTVLDLQEEYVDPVLLADQVAHWRAAGLRVVLAEGPNAVPDTFSRMSTMPLAHIQASYPVLEVSYEHKPAEIWEQTLDVRFSEVVSTP